MEYDGEYITLYSKLSLYSCFTKTALWFDCLSGIHKKKPRKRFHGFRCLINTGHYDAIPRSNRFCDDVY